MTLPKLALAVIGDEIGPSLDEMISFCAEHEVRRLDMRTVNGKSLLAMTPQEFDAVGRRLDVAGLTVPTFVSPVLKWVAPDQGASGAKVDFAFDPKDCPSDDPLARAFDVAVVLGALRVRAFSYLRYPGFRAMDIEAEMGQLVGLGEMFDIAVELENEPVCNIGSVAELRRYFDELEQEEGEVSRLLRPLVDIANSWSMGQPPSDDDIAALAPRIDSLHLKDRDLAAKKTVPFGDGDIPWAKTLERLLRDVKVPEVLVSIETHCPQDPRNATARSVAGLRRIAAEIGVTVI